MSWLVANKRIALVVVATLAVPVVLVLYAVVSLASLGLEYQGEIEQLEPRIARMLGASRSEEQLLAAADRTGSSIEHLVYAMGDDPDAVAATMQKNVRGILSGAGLEVTDSRIETAGREGAFDVVGVAVSVTGGIEALDEALYEIVAHKPLLLVTDISVSPLRSSRHKAGAPAKQVLSAKINLQTLVGVE